MLLIIHRITEYRVRRNHKGYLAQPFLAKAQGIESVCKWDFNKDVQKRKVFYWGKVKDETNKLSQAYVSAMQKKNYV